MLHVKGLAFVVKIFTADNTDTTETWPPNLQELLNEFDDVFQTPEDLPPQRSCDHHIPLIHPDKTVSARPYKYPYFKKIEIERQMQDMVQSGIIRPSSSPFASLVVLVKKSNGSWRMCVLQVLKSKYNKRSSSLYLL